MSTSRSDALSGRVDFRLADFVEMAGQKIPCERQLTGLGYAGVRTDSWMRARLKTLLWPLLEVWSYLLVDGFIGRSIGRLIREYAGADCVFLDVGCGGMRLRRHVPAHLWYNGFDVSLSEFLVRRAFRRQKTRTNIALASAKRIPLDSESVSLIACMEVLEHIPGVDEAMDELHRVLRPGGIALISIPNNYCRKYKVKGPHADHVNNWTFQEFVDVMARHGFTCLNRFMMGYWLGLPTRTSYQLPLTAKDEFENTNFFYVFRRNPGTPANTS